MLDENHLIEKLLKVEALFLGATTNGEKEAARLALGKINQKINDYKKDRPTEWTLKTRNIFDKKLLVALLKRYQLNPYRYRRQRYTTVMVNASGDFINNILWPEYLEMSALLKKHLEDITEKIIKKAITKEDLKEDIKDELLQIESH